MYLQNFVRENVSIEVKMLILLIFAVNPEGQLVTIGGREGLKVAENVVILIISVCFLKTGFDCEDNFLVVLIVRVCH